MSTEFYTEAEAREEDRFFARLDRELEGIINDYDTGTFTKEKAKLEIHKFIVEVCQRIDQRARKEVYNKLVAYSKEIKGMRAKQREYFMSGKASADKRRQIMVESKNLEKRVDELTQRIAQPKRFGIEKGGAA